MADDAEDLESGQGGSKKLLLIGIAGVLLLLLGGGGGAYWYLFMQPAEMDVALEEEGLEEDEVMSNVDLDTAIYHRLRPKFISTYEANNRQRYMQVEVTLVTRDEGIVGDLVTHQPLIRNALVMLFAQQDYLELQTPQGKSNLRRDARSTVQKLMRKEAGHEGIDGVLFTEFVMQ